MAAPAAVELALDQNFPEPILAALDKYMPDIRLTPLRKIDVRLTDLEDRLLVIALHQLGWSGLVTNNYKMLQNPSELAAIIKTKLTIFAIAGVGDDPLRATGALLLDLPGAVRRMAERPGSVFWLRPRAPKPQDPWALFRDTSQRRHEEPDRLYQQVKVTDSDLAASVLGD